MRLLCRVGWSLQRWGSRPTSSFSALNSSIFDDANKADTIRRAKRLPKNKAMRKLLERPDVHRAAVLVAMCTVEGEPSLLYTLRSRLLRKHYGEVSFPGGLEDADDEHLCQTAVREAEEEIGLDPACVKTWTVLPPMTSRTTFSNVVFPVLAYCGELDISTLRINKEEVEEVFSIPLKTLCNTELHRHTQFRSPPNFTSPVFLGGPHRIWGLTSIFTVASLSVLVPNFYSFSGHARYIQPVKVNGEDLKT